MNDVLKDNSITFSSEVMKEGNIRLFASVGFPKQLFTVIEKKPTLIVGENEHGDSAIPRENIVAYPQGDDYNIPGGS